ncbi:MAG: MATE family efflux transporter [Clostridia bacterium]|nr:MATE family efflux transporter [Clostridia bacterium]
MRKNEVNMLSGSVMKGLLTISVPIMIMNVLQSLFSIVDMTVLKIYDTSGGYSVGAVGASSTLISLITGLLIGISAGANVIIAKYIGKGETESIEKSVSTSIAFSIIGGVALLLIGVLFSKLFLKLTNCPDSLLEQAVLYFKLYFIGSPILMLYNFFASILRATGDSKRPMVFLTIGGIVKVFFNFLFVGVFKMQVVGVALATIASWSISAFLAGYSLYNNQGAVNFRFRRIKIYGSYLKEILIIGIPTGMQQVLYSIANVIITSTVNTFGPDATTGISIANQFDAILYQISVAPSLAVMPYVSQNVGAKNIKRAKESTYKGLMITILFGASFGSLSAIFSGQLSSIMSNDPNVIAYSRQKMVIISSTYFISGINEVLGGALKGMGKPIVPMVCTLLFMCVIRFFWVYLIFPLYRNLTFLYLIWPIGWILSTIVLTIFLLITTRSLVKKFNTVKEKVN